MIWAAYRRKLLPVLLDLSVEFLQALFQAQGIPVADGLGRVGHVVSSSNLSGPGQRLKAGGLGSVETVRYLTARCKYQAGGARDLQRMPQKKRNTLSNGSTRSLSTRPKAHGPS